jgi:quercetin dioxygenase-like cupin family protein
MALTRIDRWDVRRDGPLSEAALQRKIEALGFVVKARTYPAGVGSPAPAEDLHRITGVVRGLVRLTIDGDQTLLAAGDLAFVPRGAVRRVELVGQTTALCLEAVQRLEPTRLPDGPDNLPGSAH